MAAATAASGLEQATPLHSAHLLALPTINTYPCHLHPSPALPRPVPLPPPPVSQSEIESLYSRFRALDRGRKGYITADEFLAIPELSINPLAQRLVRHFESVNFKEFVKLLAPFSSRATRDMKLASMFRVSGGGVHRVYV